MHKERLRSDMFILSIDRFYAVASLSELTFTIPTTVSHLSNKELAQAQVPISVTEG